MRTNQLKEVTRSCTSGCGRDDVGYIITGTHTPPGSGGARQLVDADHRLLLSVHEEDDVVAVADGCMRDESCHQLLESLHGVLPGEIRLHDEAAHPDRRLAERQGLNTILRCPDPNEAGTEVDALEEQLESRLQHRNWHNLHNNLMSWTSLSQPTQNVNLA